MSSVNCSTEKSTEGGDGCAAGLAACCAAHVRCSSGDKLAGEQAGGGVHLCCYPTTRCNAQARLPCQPCMAAPSPCLQTRYTHYHWPPVLVPSNFLETRVWRRESTDSRLDSREYREETCVGVLAEASSCLPPSPPTSPRSRLADAGPPLLRFAD